MSMSIGDPEPSVNKKKKMVIGEHWTFCEVERETRDAGENLAKTQCKITVFLT